MSEENKKIVNKIAWTLYEMRHLSDGMTSAKNLRFSPLITLTASEQIQSENGTRGTKLFLSRTDLRLPGATQKIDLPELVPNEKDPVLSITWRAPSGIPRTS